MRGEILRIDDDGGLISGDDGNRYAFGRADIRPSDHLVPGVQVDFLPHGDRAGELIRLPTPAYPQRPPLGPDTDRTSPWGYYVRCLKKYVDGYGRGRRKEYWFFTLFQTLIFVGAFMLLATVGYGASVAGPEDVVSLVVGILAILLGLVWLAMIPPGVCAMIRRFHDVGLSGWLVLLGLIPYVGGLITFVITVLPSQPYPNKHGPVPGRAVGSTADIFT